MHKYDDKYPTRPGFDVVPKGAVPVDTKEPSGPALYTMYNQQPNVVYRKTYSMCVTLFQ